MLVPLEIAMVSVDEPSRDEFANLLMGVLNDISDGQQHRYDPESFKLVRDDEDGEVNLANLYREYCSAPEDERAEHLRRVASIFGMPQEVPEDWESAKSHLRPKIWARSIFEFMELKRQFQGGEDFNLPLYPLGSHLYSSLVYDTDSAMRTVSKDELKDWGVTYYEALEVAIQNLEETSVAYARLGDHMHASMSGDNYDSSRVLLLDKIKSFPVIGDHIALVPQRDTMYVAGSDDETSLKVMLDLTDQVLADEPRPLCPLPLKLEDGVWVDWMPPKNHVLRERFEDLELQFFGELYSEQKELLEAGFDGNETAPYVSSFSALREESTGRLRSYCVWGEGVDMLLPRTQLIMLATEEGLVASGEWEHVVGVAGDLIAADEGYYPTRYRVREFPPARQIAEIGLVQY